MKIQSVTLNWGVSLAMNLSGGRQRHRQRLIPTEERGLQDTARLKITAALLFLWTWRRDWYASTSVCSYLHSKLWTQFGGQTAKGKNQTSCSINSARFCYQVREDIGEVVREEIKRNVALRSGKSHCCDQRSRRSTAQSMEDAKLKRWVDGPLRKQTSLKVSQSDVQACELMFVASLLSYQKAKADLFTSCGAVQTKHLKR